MNVIFDITMSLDGFITADGRTHEQPMGPGGDVLHTWAFAGGDRDRAVLTDGVASVGAIIVGRRTYDTSIEWWGDTGPSGDARHPVVVLSHSSPDDMPASDVYHFASGVDRVLEQAQALAKGRDVCVMGGAETGRQFLRAGRIDELSIHLAPVLLGRGTRLFEDLGLGHISLENAAATQTAAATHLRLRLPTL